MFLLKSSVHIYRKSAKDNTEIRGSIPQTEVKSMLLLTTEINIFPLADFSPSCE